MSTLQWRALAVCSWLVAICFALPALAAYEDYTLYRDGARVTATVTASRARGEHVAATLAFVQGGETREWQTYTTGEPERFAPGAAVQVLLHENTGEPILARDLTRELPSPWLVVGFVAAIAGGVLLWRIPRRVAARRAARTDPFEAVVEAAARTRNVSAAIGVVFVGVGALFAALPALDPSGGLGSTIAIEVLAAITLAVAVGLLVRAWRLRDPRQNRVIALIAERPHEIAWFYVEEFVARGGIKTLAVHVGTVAGARTNLILLAEDEASVMDELARRAPQARRGPPGKAAGVVAALLVCVVAGCGSSEPSWLTEMKPHMQGSLDDHGKKLAPALAKIPALADLRPIACSGKPPAPPEGKVPSLGRDFADQLAKGGVQTMSMKPGHSDDFLVGAPYRALCGDIWTYSPSSFEPAMKALDGATLAGVFVTAKLDKGAISTGAIERNAHWEGWFVLLDLAGARVLAQVPVTADSDDMIMIHNDQPAEVQLLDNLDGNVHAAAAAALTGDCAGLAPI